MFEIVVIVIFEIVMIVVIFEITLEIEIVVIVIFEIIFEIIEKIVEIVIAKDTGARICAVADDQFRLVIVINNGEDQEITEEVEVLDII